MITPETVERILDATHIEEVVGEFVSLKKRGVNLLGLCPFHNEKTPSFTVSSAKGIYKCFGCGKGGNAVNFLMEHEHYTYPEALRYLANKYGIEIEEVIPSPEQQQVLDEKESLFQLTAFAQKYFQEQLHHTEEGKAIGISYFKERGFSKEMILKFGLGYALNQWDAFSQYAIKNGYKKELLQKASLSKVKDHQIYDTFRGRVIFPIHNLSGRVLGFGARILGDDKNKPKYINSAESDIYHKGRVLYGIYFARNAIVAQDNCYLTEGYTDVIGLHQAGIENVIATSGTALGSDQVKLIRRYTSNVTLLFDSDPAGLKAAIRGIDLILEEAMNVRVVLFPKGEDPDSFSRERRPAEVRQFIEENARDFISFKTDLLLEETRNDPIKKAALIKEIARTISLIPDAIARSLYVQRCSEQMQVEERFLVAEINRLRRERYKKQRASSSNQADYVPENVTEETSRQIQPQESLLQHNANDTKEKEVIRVLLHYAEEMLVFEVENDDKHMEEVRIKVADFVVQDILDDRLGFENPSCSAVFTAYEKGRKAQRTPLNTEFVNHPDPGVSTLAVDLLSSPYALSKNWEERHHIYVPTEQELLKQTVLEVVYAFKLQKLEQMISENQRLLKEMQDQKEADHDAMIGLIKANQQLKAIRNTFAKELNRIVVK